MKHNQAATRISRLALSALLGMATIPALGLAADDAQAEREARRLENEARREQEMGRRDMENRERAQAEALRGQEQAIRRMEATQSRMEAGSQQLNQQSAEQARANSYPYYPSSGLNVPQVPVGPARQNDAISSINFAPLSERLKSYFGAQSGVLVVSAGDGAPFGLQDGDVIISVDGRVPLDGSHAARILRSYQPGERVKLRVQRDHRVLNLDSATPGSK